MAISSSSSSSSFEKEVQNCSKQCLESFKTLQKNFDSEREKHSRARLEIQGYELAIESLESRILGHEKNELAWGEKYEFQNYKLKCREIKIKNLKMELEKVVKERDELKVKIEKWEESSKGINKLLNSQMSAKDKNGLEYGTQLDEMSNKSETDSEISMSVFEVRSCNEEITPTNDRFSKADGYHVVPPPITGNFLTPRVDISFAGLDEYAIRKKIIESKTTEPRDDTSESKTSETVGKTNEVEKSKTKINRENFIIEDWNSDDEDDVSEVNTVSPVKTNETQTVKTQVDKIGQISQKEGIRFKKIKACFVCKSTDHLIKDCDFYAKKSPKPKLKAVVNTGQRVVKPVWDNAKRGNPEICLQDHAVVDSGCSSHMTGNKAYLLDYEDYNGGFVAFGSDPKGGKITGKGKSVVSMANLEFVDQHNMVACLEKTEGNSDFHEIVDFLASSLIHHALTINATIDSKAVVVTKASIRSSLVFNDADGGHKYDRAESALNLQALSVLCTNLSNRVLALESIKDAQAAEISALKSRINKFRKKEYVSKQGRKKSKPESTLGDSTVFDDQDANHEVVKEKSSGDKGGNDEELVRTARPEEEKAKEKGVSIKDVDDSSRPARSILTLKPLPIIDPKDKGKGVLKESPVKKVKRSDLDAAQIAKDAEIARLVHEKELAEMEREREERLRQDQASMDYIESLYDEVQAKMDASEELAARLQMEERERYIYTIEERSKLLAEFFEMRKKLLAEERAAAVRNKPPIRTQLRSLMMTYLKHTGKYRHNKLNKKTFEEIQALYIKEQERDIDFVPIRSERDEKMIDKMNKKAAGMDEEEVPEEPESTKVEVKQEGREENIRKRSGRRLKIKATKKSKRQKTDSDLEEKEQLRASLKIVPDEEEEINYEVFVQKTFTEMVSRFDRLDFIELHSLVMQRFSTTTPEGIDLVLRGDLRIMFEETANDDIWNNQEKWIIKSWTFYENCRVHILALEDGTEIHMLAKRRYPLIRETLERIMELRLTAESEVISAPCYRNEALAIPEQTATGKEISNPFMAGSLPKTT
ncbi:hypothetical protein Tco_0860733 [Tanacetum coccineum]|uniref:Retrovirus-related Pol polyprotein from transposon TNT 1-94-like beta-barrel domain-containing protein n=1 Tax=Tanacetum coccineum TaxID=301880 RepID=A0ABQ5BGC5_9ASTR